MQPDEAMVQVADAPDSLVMLEAMRLGVEKALANHHAQGVSIITWDASAQRIVEVPADEIPAWTKATAEKP